MPIAAHCPNCKHPIQLPDAAAGRAVRCPYCKVVHTAGAAPQTGSPAARAAAPLRPAPPVPAAARPVVSPPPPSKQGSSAPSAGRARLPTAWKWLLVGAAAYFALTLLVAGAVALTHPWSHPEIPPRGADATRGGGSGGEQSLGDTTTQPSDRRAFALLKNPPPDPPDPPGTVSPLVQIQIHSFAKIKESLRLIMKPFQMEQVLDDQMRPVDLAAIDAARPWGAYLLLDDDKLGAFVGAVPVKDAIRFGNMLRDMHFIEESRDGEIVVVQSPAIQQVQLMPDQPTPMLPAGTSPKLAYRIARGYAWFVQAPDRAALDDAKLVPPAQLFAGADGADLTVTLRLDRIPLAWSSRVAEQLTAVKRMMPAPEDEALRGYSDTVTGLLAQYAGDILEGGRRLTLRLNVDNKDQTAAADLTLTASNHSRLADNIASLAAVPSRFGGLVPDDPILGVRLNLRLPAALREPFRSVVAESTKMMLNDATGPQERADREQLFNAVGPTFAAGELDFAAAVVGRGEGRPATVIGALRVAEGERLDKFFGELVAHQLADKKDRDLFKLHAYTLGDVAVSQFRPDGLFVGPFGQALGNEPMCYGFGPDALYWSAGEGGEAALRQAVGVKARPGPMAEITLNARQFNAWMPLQPGDAAQAAEELSNDHPGRFSVSVEGGSALPLRMNMDLSLITFIGKRLVQIRDAKP